MGLDTRYPFPHGGQTIFRGPLLLPGPTLDPSLYLSPFSSPFSSPSRSSGSPLGLTCAGVLHHRVQVPALAHVHGHEGCVLADDTAGLAGVHGTHLVAATGPCRARDRGHCLGSKVLPDRKVLEAESRMWPIIPIFGIN